MLTTSPDKRILDFREIIEVVQTSLGALTLLAAREVSFIHQMQTVES